MHDQDFAKRLRQALENAADVAVRLCWPVGVGVTELEIVVSGVPAAPLAVAVQGDADEPGAELGLAPKRGQARRGARPRLLQKVACVRPKWPKQTYQHPVDRRRVAAVEPDKGRLIAPAEPADENAVGDLVVS